MVFLTKPAGTSVPTERVRIDYNGYVGIGTASPTAMLEVNGNTKISGSLTAGGLLYPTSNGTNGQVLSSNGIGGVNWQNGSLTIGTTSIDLGTSTNSLSGLTNVTSTNFIGTLSGTASTANKLSTARNIKTVS